MIFCETSTRIESAHGQWLNYVFDSTAMGGEKETGNARIFERNLFTSEM